MPSIKLAIGDRPDRTQTKQVQNTLIAGWHVVEQQADPSYGFQCSAGQPTQIDVLSSWDNLPSSCSTRWAVRPLHDDDGGEGLNARLRFTCPTTGLYRLGVTTGLASTTPGAYTLQVQATGQPMQMQPDAAAHHAAHAATDRAAHADGADDHAADGKRGAVERHSGAGQVGQIMAGQSASRAPRGR